jgi:hypothetical protein
MRMRPPTRDPVRAAELRTWLRKPEPTCPPCVDAERAEPSDLDGPTDERLFRCAGCGRVRRPRSTEPHDFQEV